MKRNAKLIGLTNAQVRHVQSICPLYGFNWYECQHELLYRRYSKAYGEQAASRMVAELQRQSPWLTSSQRMQAENRYVQLELLN